MKQPRVNLTELLPFSGRVQYGMVAIPNLDLAGAAVMIPGRLPQGVPSRTKQNHCANSRNPGLFVKSRHAAPRPKHY